MSGFIVPGLTAPTTNQQNNQHFPPQLSSPYPQTTGYPTQQSAPYPPQPVLYPSYPTPCNVQQPPQPGYPYSPGCDPQANPYLPSQNAYQYPPQDYNPDQHPPNDGTSSRSKIGLTAGATAVAGAAGAALASGMKALSGDKKHKGEDSDHHYQNQDNSSHKDQKPNKHGKKGYDDVAQFGQTVLQSGVMGPKGRYAGSAIGVARADPTNKSGGLLGTAAARGMMGHKGRMAAHAMGMGRPKDHGGMSAQSVLGSGLLGSRGSQTRIVAGAAIKLVGVRIHK